jgi:hypothetical protein
MWFSRYIFLFYSSSAPTDRGYFSRWADNNIRILSGFVLYFVLFNKLSHKNNLWMLAGNKYNNNIHYWVFGSPKYVCGHYVLILKPLLLLLSSSSWKCLLLGKVWKYPHNSFIYQKKNPLVFCLYNSSQKCCTYLRVYKTGRRGFDCCQDYLHNKHWISQGGHINWLTKIPILLVGRI